MDMVRDTDNFSGFYKICKVTKYFLSASSMFS
jgi:hypothetical protein